MILDAIKALARVGTVDAVAAFRITIDDQAQAGTMPADQAAALQTVARGVAEELAAAPPPAAAPPLPAGRLRATIREAIDDEYPDSGAVVRGTVAVQTDAGELLVRFRLSRSWEGSIKALFHSCGLSSGDPAEQLAGKEVAVELGTFTGQDGNERPIVKRWHKLPAATATSSKPAASKPAAPKWEADEHDPRPDEAAARAPRRTPAAKAHQAFKAAATDDDPIPF